MLNIGIAVSVSSTKTLAANAAATASKKAAQTGKSGNKMADTSCHHMSKRDLAYFSSERFARTLRLLEDRELASKYGELIAWRKRAASKARAQQVVEAVIYVDIYDAHNDGFKYTFDEVRDLFKGYRSQALREVKKASGFNALVYRELAKALDSREEVRNFLKAINKPILREKPLF